jgi:hypothetical protein
MRARIRRRPTPRVALALALLAVAVPAVAVAGTRTVSGAQSLKITAALSPKKAGAKRTTLKLHVDYESTKPNQHIQYTPKSIKLTVPKGLHFLAKNAPRCSEHAFGTTSNKDRSTACPKGSLVGSGKVTADARPAAPDPITGTLSIYNSRYDCTCYTHRPGAKMGSQDLLFYIKTTVGVNALLVFNVLPNGSIEDYEPKPEKGKKPIYSLKTLDFSIGKDTKKPFVRAPSTCDGKWPFALTITNFDGPSITARHKAACAD